MNQNGSKEKYVVGFVWRKGKEEMLLHYNLKSQKKKEYDWVGK